MTSPVETTAAMTPPADQHDPADAADGSAASGVTALAEPASGEGVAGVAAGEGQQAAGRRELSQNAVIGLFGGLVIALLGALIGLMMWQFDALGDRIDGLDARIDRQGARIDSQGHALGDRIDALGTELRAEMDNLESGLRAEMQAGFAEINAVLLDHTDRLARLETAAGLPRPGG